MEDLLAKQEQVEIISASGAKWVPYPSDERLSLTFMQRYHLSDVVSKILVGRKMTLDTVNDYLSPTLRNILPDPFHLLDMDKAIERIIEAIHAKEKIAIFGDYDVDGATSSALFVRYFRMLGIDIEFYIPDRIEEGYGPNSNALSKLKEQGTSLCITVDCGTLSYEPLAHAKSIGLDVIVLDHHIGGEEQPEAVAVVNPNRLDETSEVRNLAAVGVSFLTLVGLNSRLRANDYFQGTKEPDLLSLLDIVALGTVCDVMTLTGLNRAFVAQGLKVLAKRENLGLTALMDTAGLDELPSVYHLGFVIGPRINAGGRVGKANLGTRLLTTQDHNEAYEISAQLDHFNGERKAIEQQVQEEATLQIENGDPSAPFLIAKGEGWHPGVIGIVAGRIKDKYHRPTAVISLENGIGKASARSITGIDLGSAIAEARELDLLLAGGGHAAAAGFTIEEEKIEKFQQFLSEKFTNLISEYGTKIFKYDGYLSPAAITVPFIKSLQQLSPFGMGNPEPRFVIKSARIVKTAVLGENHIRAIVTDSQSSSMKGSLTAMAFRSLDTPIGNVLLNAKGRPVDLLGHARINFWQGRESAQFLIDDVLLGSGE